MLFQAAFISSASHNDAVDDDPAEVKKIGLNIDTGGKKVAGDEKKGKIIF